MKKVAIIIGAEGQDGKIAFDYLSEKGYSIIGIDRNVVKTKDINWKDEIDISNKQNVFELLKKVKPNEIYYFAAFHQSSEDKLISEAELFEISYKINVFSLINFLEGIKLHSPESRIFYTASSLIFGDCELEIQDERTLFNPNTIYGITKLDGLMACRYYRNNYGLFASVGIMYNHESAYRSEKFISMKIIQGAINIKNESQDELIVGDLNAEVDWGYAPDYIDAMHRILNIEYADDFIIATGKKHLVKDFITNSFGYLDLDWKKFVKESQQILTRKRRAMIGNFDKLKNTTGWEPKVSFEEMIKIIIDLKR